MRSSGRLFATRGHRRRTRTAVVRGSIWRNAPAGSAPWSSRSRTPLPQARDVRVASPDFDPQKDCDTEKPRSCSSSGERRMRRP